MIHPFLECLEKGTLLCDGAMGTMLYARGISFEHGFDELNLSNPKLVQEIHRDYIRAGAEMIETNTFGGNRFRLRGHDVEEKVREINLWGAKIARDVRETLGKSIFVAGSVGPIGQPLEPIGRITLKEAKDAFREQMEGLLEGGVDLFILETFSNLEELQLAISACKEIAQLPIIAQMTFGEENRTMDGHSPEGVAKSLKELEVDVVGVNCSVGPQGIFEVIQRMATVLVAQASLPVSPYLSALPNAGLPGYVEGRFIYYSTPEYMADYAKRFIEAGARIVGGCCGTTPDHIRAMHKSLQTIQPSDKTVQTITIAPPEPDTVSQKPLEAPGAFAKKLGKVFQVSVELTPPKGTNPQKLLAGAHRMKERGVDVVNITDGAIGRIRMSAFAICVLIKEQVGMETLLHVTCRDRNLIGLQMDLIGAHAAGIRNLMVITGDPPQVGDYPNATAVYDVDSIGLVRTISRLNQGEDWMENSIGDPTSFCIGVAVNPSAEDLDHELDRFRQKIEAGAHFAYTQPQYDLETIHQFLERIDGIDLPVFLGLLPLQSYKHAEFLHNEVPGIVIPEAVQERMRKAGEKGADVGVQMARDLLEQARSHFKGAYLMPSFGRYERVLEVLER
ncbi:bifunctional homocysteine S-methyltransferase/methylenetetrahydrofolate reductase [candidate division TA06 bacterium]|nr:bifunctional homocysteine S-methyltransferase/methylenetetrahydrofolate reductase [candidate division TA06 bacterium]